MPAALSGATTELAAERAYLARARAELERMRQRTAALDEQRLVDL